jgi:hypothetical protein
LGHLGVGKLGGSIGSEPHNNSGKPRIFRYEQAFKKCRQQKTDLFFITDLFITNSNERLKSLHNVWLKTLQRVRSNAAWDLSA